MHQPNAAAPLHYDRTSMRLHWLSAALVLLLWCLGETIDWFPRGAPRVGARSAHIVAGAVLALILVWRIWWRAARGARLAPAELGRLDALARFVHVLLYFVAVATVVLGLANVWMRGDSIFGVFSVPQLAADNRALRHQVEELHGLFANGLLILAGLHAAAALVHHFVWKDNVLRRMWPQRG